MKLQVEQEAEEEEIEHAPTKGGKNKDKITPERTILGLLKNHLIIVTSRITP